MHDSPIHFLLAHSHNVPQALDLPIFLNSSHLQQLLKHFSLRGNPICGIPIEESISNSKVEADNLTKLQELNSISGTNSEIDNSKMKKFPRL